MRRISKFWQQYKGPAQLFISGALISVIGYQQYVIMQPLSRQLAKEIEFDAKKATSEISEVLKSYPVVNDALAVRTTLSANQFGKEFIDRFANDGRKSIIAHPYSKQGTGVTVTAIYRDANNGKFFVLLPRKLNVRNQPEQGLQSTYDSIGGYTLGAAVEGGSNAALHYSSSENKDAAEDRYLQTGNDSDLQNAVVIKNEAAKQVTRDDFLLLSKEIMNFYRQKVKNDPYLRILNGGEIKVYLASKGVIYQVDYNQLDTASREFLEETGYNGNIKNLAFEQVYTSGDYAINGEARLHTMVTNYLVDLGTLDEAPYIHTSTDNLERYANSFKPNNSEIGDLQWVNIEDIQIVKTPVNIQMHYHGVPIKEVYYPILNNNIKYIRDKKIAEITCNKFGHPLFKSSEEVIYALENKIQDYEKVGQITLELVGKKPDDEFGQAASKYHIAIKKLARYLKKVYDQEIEFDLAELQRIIKGPQYDIQALYKQEGPISFVR